MSTDRQKQLQKFLKRRHPLYEAMEAHWSFLADTYEGGRGWFQGNIFQYVKEGEKEYAERVKRAYRFNHTHEVVDLVVKYLFKMQVSRSEEVSEDVKTFWQNSTRMGQEISEFMRTVATQSSIYGRVWVVVDTNKTSETRSVAEDKEAGVRVYAYTVEPQHVLDVSYADDGELNWVLIREIVRDDADPISSSGSLSEQFRLWTRDSSQLFTVRKEGQKVIVTEDAPSMHNLGVVPIVNADNVLTEDKWVAPAMIADVAYLDRACANYLSNLDAIIQDQTFSQLAMPSQGIPSDTEAYTKLVELGTKRVFVYDGGEGGNEPRYISPDVKQAELILKVINKIINEIYHSVGLAGERTKEDNALGIDNSSGVAKAYDFERVNSLLTAKAQSLEQVENRIAALVDAYAGKEIDPSEEYVEYPHDFDVRGLYDEFEIAARLALIEAPDGMRRYQMESVIEKLFPMLKEELKNKMVSELKSWPPKIDLETAGASASQSPLKKTGAQALSSKLVGGGKQKSQI
jgi:hypothetical protein